MAKKGEPQTSMLVDLVLGEECEVWIYDAGDALRIRNEEYLMPIRTVEFPVSFETVVAAYQKHSRLKGRLEAREHCFYAAYPASREENVQNLLSKLEQKLKGKAPYNGMLVPS